MFGSGFFKSVTNLTRAAAEKAGNLWDGTRNLITREAKKAKNLFDKGVNIARNVLVGSAEFLCAAGLASFNAWNHVQLVGWNALISILGGSLGAAVGSLPSWAQKGLKDFFRSDKGVPEEDGKYMGAGCKTSAAPPDSGIKPSSSKCGKGPFPKKYYINGINTDPSDQCKTLKKLASVTCSEFVGVHNASQGMMADLAECLDNIERTGNTPSKDTLMQVFRKKLLATPPEKVELFAHSQGGLITQQAISDFRSELAEKNMSDEEIEEILSNLHVTGLGTVVAGWPKGPKYELILNTADPVPATILGVQVTDHLDQLDKLPISDDNSKLHTFNDPHINPIDSHSMDDTYLPYYEELLEDQGGG